MNMTLQGRRFLAGSYSLGEGAEGLTVTKERKSPVQGGLHRGSYINGVLIYSATNSFISE